MQFWVTAYSGKSSRPLTSCLFYHLRLVQGTRKGPLRSSYLVIRMRHVHSVQYTQPWVLTQQHSWEGAAGEQEMEDTGEKREDS